jgi:hypothetical protein
MDCGSDPHRQKPWQIDDLQDPIPGRPDLPDILQALQSMQLVEACQEKEEGEMRE